MGLNKTGFDAGLRSADTQVRKFSGQVKGYLAGAFSVAAIAGFTRAALGAASAVGNLADQSALTIEQVQELQGLAGKMGLEFSGVQNFVTALQRARREALLGKEDIVDMFNQIGLSQEQISESKPMEFLKSFAQGFAKFDEASKAAMIEQIGGARSAKLARLVSMVGAGVKDDAPKFAEEDVKTSTAILSGSSDFGKALQSKLLRVVNFVIEGLGAEIERTDGEKSIKVPGIMAALARSIKKSKEAATEIDSVIAATEKEGAKSFVPFKKKESESGAELAKIERPEPLSRFSQPLTDLQQIGAQIKTARDPIAEKSLRVQMQIAAATKATADAIKQGGAQFP